MKITTVKCRRCNGNMTDDEDGSRCLLCGRPPLGKIELSDYYLQHRDEITADFQRLGNQPTRKKWAIPSSTFQGLLIRWGIWEGKQRQAKPASGANGSQPAFPAFNDTWPEAVQLKWLEV